MSKDYPIPTIFSIPEGKILYLGSLACVHNQASS